MPSRRARRAGFVDGPVVIRSGMPARTELREAATLPVRWTHRGDGRNGIAEGAADDRSLGLAGESCRRRLSAAAHRCDRRDVRRCR